MTLFNNGLMEADFKRSCLPFKAGYVCRQGKLKSTGPFNFVLKGRIDVKQQYPKQMHLCV